MKKFVPILLALALTACAVRENPVPQPTPPPQVSWNQSVVAITDASEDIYCTGFVIDNVNDYVMTANHCTNNGPIFVEGQPADILWQDAYLDAAVLYVPIDHPALEPGPVPNFKDEVTLIGFGYGWPRGMMRTAHISHPRAIAPEEPMLQGEWVMWDVAPIPGQSGGPVLKDGKVVAVVQLGNYVVGFGRSVEDIYRETARFWELPL